jgi:hypothetical protein
VPTPGEFFNRLPGQAAQPPAIELANRRKIEASTAARRWNNECLLPGEKVRMKIPLTKNFAL